MHRPELALRPRGLGRLRRQHRVRMRAAQRKVAEGEGQALAERALERLGHAVRAAAVRTLVVAELAHHDRRAPIAEEVIAIAERRFEPTGHGCASLPGHGIELALRRKIGASGRDAIAAGARLACPRGRQRVV